MLDAATILAIAGTFLIAGAVKGVIGLGLPTVSLALLAVAIQLPNAMAVLLVPSFVTNIWQATVGGHGRALLRRIWPFLLVATTTVGLGASALTRVDLSLLIRASRVAARGVRRHESGRTATSGSKPVTKGGRGRWPDS